MPENGKEAAYTLLEAQADILAVIDMQHERNIRK